MLRVLLLALSVIVVVSLLPVESTQPSAFADPAFSRYQRRAGAQGRALLWGGDPLVAVVEAYIGAPGDRRLVEYYERGRMELDDSTPGGVTEGLLVREMVTGSVQQGDDVVVQQQPADTEILSGPDTEQADIPSYADFAPLTEPVDGAGRDTILDTWIDGDGSIRNGEPPARLLAGRFVEETGHSIPDVFTEWERSEPFGAIDALQALGYPITEPYWVHTGLGDDGISLIQLFERRVVVYTPDLPSTERFSLTSSGRHYYRWRYGEEPASSTSADRWSLVPSSGDNGGVQLPDGLHMTTLPLDISNVVDIAVAPGGTLALAVTDGTVRFASPTGTLLDADPYVDGLSGLVALAFSGADLFVMDDDGLHRFEDTDGDRVADGEHIMLTDRLDPETVALAPGPDGSVIVSGQQRSSSPPLGQTNIVSARSLIQVASDGSLTEIASPGVASGASYVADSDGVLWLVDADQRLIAHDPATDTTTSMLDASALGGESAVIDLLVYRPDGATGDPNSDLIALVSGDNSRIVRLKPAHQGVTPSGTGTPDTRTQPGAIVDYVSGFERPIAMAAGLDGSLYVLDPEKGHLLRIQPD